MSEPIKVGDLVVVVRAHCSSTAIPLGMVRTVRDIYDGSPICMQCGDRALARVANLGIDPSDGRLWAIPLSQLKRIPPLSELEGQKTEETIHA